MTNLQDFKIGEEICFDFPCCYCDRSFSKVVMEKKEVITVEIILKCKRCGEESHYSEKKTLLK